MAAVEVAGLVVRYGDVVAVDGVSFEAQAGQITAVLGPNGAGKTTTIEVLEGYRRPDAGWATVVGFDPARDHRALTHRVGVMLQAGGVGSGVRAGEALRHAAALYAHALPPDELLERVGLAAKQRRSWRQLSGGEQRRLALALALVGRPQVVFLDEPGSGVDPQGRQVLRDVISGLRDDGVTVVLTSHDLDEVERLADHVVILDGGRLVAQGTPAKLTASGTSKEVRFSAPPGLEVAALAARLTATPGFAEPAGVPGRLERARSGPAPPARDVPPPEPMGTSQSAAGSEPGSALVLEERPGEYVIHAAPTPALLAAVTAWLAEHDVPLGDLRAGRQRLQDVFLRLLEEHSHESSSSSPASEDRHSAGRVNLRAGRRRNRR